MKSVILLALFVAAAVAAPANPEAAAKIISQDSDVDVTQYKYSYSTENKISANEQGAVQDLGTENEGNEVIGFFEYVGLDGNTYRVEYTAGRNGFRPIGGHIPVA